MGGVLFNIKRMAVHDGPGLRTTVFLKGCSLRCRWCHNPESVLAKTEIGFLKRKCIGCGKCVEVCPQHAHSFEKGVRVFRHELCVACGKCVEACLVGALELYGRKTSAEKVAKAVLEDKTFYEQSGGGCTVSGGEPLLQADFCAELFRRLKEDGIHCAVDTSGAVKWEYFERVLPCTDMFLYDVKHIDDALHRKHVGASNELILKNLETLSERNIPIEIRIPCIPGFNLDEKSMAGIGAFLSKLKNIVGVRLLPYHFARSKYESAGHVDTTPDVHPPSEERMQTIKTLLKSYKLIIK